MSRFVFAVFNNLNPSSRSHGKETFMRFKIIVALAASITVLLGSSSNAHAALAAFWSVQGDGELSGDAIRIERGKDVGVFVSVDDKGTFTAPTGWTTKWTAGKCSPARPQATCGTWEAHAAANTNDNPAFSYTSSEKDAKPETKVFVLNVQATGDEKFYPKSSGETDEKRITAVEKKTAGTNVTAGLYYSFVPNLPTTTQPAHGLELNMGASVIDGLYVGGAFGWSHTQIPIDMGLYPVVTSASENRFIAVGRMGWYPKWKHFALMLGGQIGVEMYQYSTTFTRQVPGAGSPVNFVRENTQYAFSIGPVLGLEFPIMENFGLGAQFSLPVAVTNVSRVIGEGADPNNNTSQTPSGTGAPKANPTISGGFKFWF